MTRSLLAFVTALLVAGNAPVATAQSIETFAGNGDGTPSSTTAPALATSVPNVQDVAIAPNGTVYLVDGSRVRFIGSDGLLVTVPGTGPRFGPGGVSTNIQASDIAVDANGRVFVTDGSRFRVLEMSTSLAFNAVIGTGLPGSSGDGGPAVVAQLSGAVGIDFDAAGNLYVAEPNRIRKVTPAGIITTVVASNFGGPPGQYTMGNIAVDGNGTVYTWFPNPPLGLWRSTAAGAFERVNPSSSVIQRCVTGPVATQAVFGPPRSGRDGLIYIANDTCVSRLTPGGQLVNVAGSPFPDFAGESGPLSLARFRGITSLAFDASGRMYIGDAGNRRVRRATGIPPFSNSPPQANAGPDQTVVVGDSVSLAGGASSDPDGDTLQYAWTIDAKPPASNAALVNSATVLTLFTPDAAGDYAVRLEVSDGSATATDEVLVRAQTFVEFATAALAATQQSIALTPDGSLDAPGHRLALGNFLEQADAAIRSGNLQHARRKLNDALERFDGCYLRGVPDARGKGSDWIVECGYQTDPYFSLSSILTRMP